MKIRIKHMIGQVLFGAYICLSISACILKKEETVVSPPLTFPLSQSYIGYGVINVSYTRVNPSIEESGASAGYLRQGSVVRVIERRMVKNEEKTEAWVQVTSIEGNIKGWLKESLMDIYGNINQAILAAKSMSSDAEGAPR